MQQRFTRILLGIGVLVMVVGAGVIAYAVTSHGPAARSIPVADRMPSRSTQISTLLRLSTATPSAPGIVVQRIPPTRVPLNSIAQRNAELLTIDSFIGNILAQCFVPTNTTYSAYQSYLDTTGTYGDAQSAASTAIAACRRADSALEMTYRLNDPNNVAVQTSLPRALQPYQDVVKALRATYVACGQADWFAVSIQQGDNSYQVQSGTSNLSPQLIQVFTSATGQEANATTLLNHLKQQFHIAS